MYHRTLRTVAVIFLFYSLVEMAGFAQQWEAAGRRTEESSDAITPRTPPPPISAMQQPVRISARPILAEGTTIGLLLTREVKVKEVKPGDTVDFVLAADLWFRDTLLARRGTPVQVSVQTAEKAMWLSRGSKLALTIQSLKLLDGSLVDLSGGADYKGGINPISKAAFSGGGKGSGIVTAGAVAIGVFGLISPGTNRNVPAGSSATAWVAKDVLLNLDSFRSLQPARDPLATTAKVQVVRGIWDRLKSRDVYCNGMPLAHLGKF